MTTQEVKRKLAAILSADAEGYSSALIERHRGKEHSSRCLQTGQRVFPAQAGKAAEITVGGEKNQSMLDGKGCQMGIRNQICPQALVNQQCFQRFTMAFGGLWNPDRRTIQPLFDLLPRFIDGFGVLENSRVGYQPNKSQKTGPGQPDGSRTAQPPVKPLPGSGVLRKVVDMSIYEQIGIDQDHRKFSPSAIAMASEISSRLPAKQRPSDTDFV